jgi:lipoprotein-anchoring transpeptidase ErfK/SrfK
MATDPSPKSNPLRHFLVVDKRSFWMTRFRYDTDSEQMERRDRYKVALGTKEYPTPTHCYTIKWRKFNPDWYLPDSPWVPEEDRGLVIPGGTPENPLVGCFLDFGFLGIGIHGTHNLDSLGTRASHGCIRVEPEVAIELGNTVPDGTRVWVG